MKKTGSGIRDKHPGSATLIMRHFEGSKKARPPQKIARNAPHYVLPQAKE
jgi:hypothetical protein